MTRTILIITLSALLGSTPLCGQKTKTGKKTQTIKKSQQKPVVEDYSEETIQKVFVIDSLVCADSDMVRNIPLPHHSGVLTSCDDGTTVYENDYGDMRFYSEKDTAGHYQIYHQEMIGNNWSTPSLLNIDATLTDMRNPFLLSDGQTLYFSGRDTSRPNRKYNIYTSTLDTETEQFRKPMALPLPYFSNNDDVLYVCDDVDSTAWLVSLRGQPHGKVCIYTIHLSPSAENYDNEELADERLTSLAKLSSIKDTWPSVEEKDKILNETIELLKSYDTISNNMTVKRDSKREAATDKMRKLDEYRRLYHNSKPVAKKKLESTILELEK